MSQLALHVLNLERVLARKKITKSPFVNYKCHKKLGDFASSKIGLLDLAKNYRNITSQMPTTQ
jgi:hypothetical protein